MRKAGVPLRRQVGVLHLAPFIFFLILRRFRDRFCSFGYHVGWSDRRVTFPRWLKTVPFGAAARATCGGRWRTIVIKSHLNTQHNLQWRRSAMRLLGFFMGRFHLQAFNVPQSHGKSKCARRGRALHFFLQRQLKERTLEYRMASFFF